MVRHGPPAWAVALALVPAGALNTAALAPAGWWWLQPIAAAVLAAAVARAPTAGRAGLWGGAFAFGWLASGWWWLHISLHQFGGLPWGAAAAAVAALAAAMSLYLAAAMAAFAALRSGRAAADALLFAALWLVAELARGQWFTGFPWSASGYAHTDGPLAALAPWIGVYGLGALGALAGAVLAFTPGDRSPGRWASLAVAVGVAGAVVAAHLAPADFTRGTGRLRASLVQPAVAQDLKFEPGHLHRNLARLVGTVHAAPGPLVVTPESVVPLPHGVLAPETWAALRAPFVGGDRALLLGLFLGDDASGYVNSMIGLSREASPAPDAFYAYGKRHLLPFGEFVPPGFGWFVRALDIPLSDQARGAHARPFAFAGQRLRPLICYEDLFADELVDSIGGADDATVFVNASNLAWFGLRLVQDQHLQFSRMRALELQRPFLRATNTGATTAIDHRGVVTHRLAAGVEGRLDVEVEGRTGTTPYAAWLRAAGHAPLWVLAAAVIGAAAWRRRTGAGRRVGPGR